MGKCIICKERFTPIRSSLEKNCQKEDCRVQWAMQVVAKQKEKQAKEKKQVWTKEKIELKEKLKTLSDWKHDLQIEINNLIRAIDNQNPCIATNSYNGKQNAGHYISIGSNDTLRFHLENIWIQSEHSNTWKSGDTLRYQKGLIDTFGQEYFEYVHSLQSIKPIKLTIEEIKPKIPLVRSLVKWVKLQDRKFTNEERVFLRKEFNEKINIYNSTHDTHD
jgi:hypothetical protein